MAISRRVLALAAGGVAAAAAAFWLAGATAPQAGTRTVRPARVRAGAAGVNADGAPPAEVRLAALKREYAPPGPDGRNPFRFVAKAPAPAPPRPAGEQLEEARAAGPPPPPPGPPPPPPIAMKFIGLVERSDGTKLAVLSDGRTTHHGREGDIIEGRYRILKIGVESLEIAYVDGRGRQTIRLTGQ